MESDDYLKNAFVFNWDSMGSSCYCPITSLESMEIDAEVEVVVVIVVVVVVVVVVSFIFNRTQQ